MGCPKRRIFAFQENNVPMKFMAPFVLWSQSVKSANSILPSYFPDGLQTVAHTHGRCDALDIEFWTLASPVLNYRKFFYDPCQVARSCSDPFPNGIQAPKHTMRRSDHACERPCVGATDCRPPSNVLATMRMSDHAWERPCVGATVCLSYFLKIKSPKSFRKCVIRSLFFFFLEKKSDILAYFFVKRSLPPLFQENKTCQSLQAKQNWPRYPMNPNVLEKI